MSDEYNNPDPSVCLDCDCLTSSTTKPIHFLNYQFPYPLIKYRLRWFLYLGFMVLTLIKFEDCFRETTMGLLFVLWFWASAIILFAQFDKSKERAGCMRSFCGCCTICLRLIIFLAFLLTSLMTIMGHYNSGSKVTDAPGPNSTTSSETKCYSILSNSEVIPCPIFYGYPAGVFFLELLFGLNLSKLIGKAAVGIYSYRCSRWVMTWMGKLIGLGYASFFIIMSLWILMAMEDTHRSALLIFGVGIFSLTLLGSIGVILAEKGLKPYFYLTVIVADFLFIVLAYRLADDLRRNDLTCENPLSNSMTLSFQGLLEGIKVHGGWFIWGLGHIVLIGNLIVLGILFITTQFTRWEKYWLLFTYVPVLPFYALLAFALILGFVIPKVCPRRTYRVITTRTTVTTEPNGRKTFSNPITSESTHTGRFPCCCPIGELADGPDPLKVDAQRWLRRIMY